MRESEVRPMFWNWLKKNHPVINEVVWWLVIAMCVAVLLK